jgi:hypothetical protein
MDDFGQEAAGIVYGLAPSKRGKYRKTIGTSTYMGGRHIAGKALGNIGKVPEADIQTIVYTSSTLGHLLEYGTQEHEIPGAFGIPHGVIHPGSHRFPHFGPGAMQSVSRIGLAIVRGIGGRFA